MKADQMETENSAFTAKRIISVPDLSSSSDADCVQESIGSLKGVYRVETNRARKQLKVVYNAARIDFSTITTALLDAGYTMVNSRWSRFKARWYQFLDQNARANSELPSTDCCSNPRSIYAKKRK